MNSVFFASFASGCFQPSHHDHHRTARQQDRSRRHPRAPDARRAFAIRPGARAREPLRPHVQQHHLRRVWRRDALLGFFPSVRRRRPGLGPRAGVGLWHGGRIGLRRGAGGRARVRLLAHGQPRRADARARHAQRLDRRRGAPRAAAAHLQPVRAQQRRPVLPRRHRRPASAAAPAVCHLVADRRLHGRQRLFRRAHAAAVQRVQQDGLCHRVVPGAAGGHRSDWPHVAGQRGVL